MIETGRLRLRRHCASDLDACAAMWGDPVVARFIGGRTATVQESWMKILRYAGLWELLGFGYWAVEEKSSGRFIGELGFAEFKRVMEPPIDGIPELGWAFASPYHGKGYATEGLRAAVAWGDANLESVRTVCIISTGNAASIRVAQKIGYTEKLRTMLGNDEVLLFERARLFDS